jgi:HK97 family phage major capsid protein
MSKFSKTEVSKTLEGLVAAAIAQSLGGDKEIKSEPPMENFVPSRDRKFELKPDQKGIPAARMIRALAFGRGDSERAKYFVQRAFNDDLGDEIHKALNASELSAGGALIVPEYAAEIIELLRSRTVVRAAGARTMPMNNGALTIRKQTVGSTASYVGESQDIGITQPETGQIDMTSKKLAAIVPISNDLLQFTAGPSADEFVRDDLVMEISIREDRAFLRDDGTQHTPRGMRHWATPANILASAGTTSDNIEEDFKDLINALENADVRLIRPAWFMHPSRKNHLRNLRDANGNLIYPEIRGPAPTLYGWPVLVTTSIPANLGVGGDESEIYFADMVDAIIAEVMGLEIVVDASASYVEAGNLQSAFSRDETLIRAISKHDFALRHRESVAVKSDVTWGA